MILRHAIGLAIALILTWMVFFGANYFGVVWTHYFADEPPKNTGEVSATIIERPHGYVGLAPPPEERANGANCPAGKTCPPPKPHD